MLVNLIFGDSTASIKKIIDFFFTDQKLEEITKNSTIHYLVFKNISLL